MKKSGTRAPTVRAAALAVSLAVAAMIPAARRLADADDQLGHALPLHPRLQRQ